MKIIASQTFYTIDSISLKRLRVEYNGKEYDRAFVDYPQAVAALPVNAAGELLLIRQERVGAGREIWEIPAGKLDAGEEPSAGVVRELREETGFSASRLMLIHTYYPAPGFCNEQIDLFLAQGLVADPLPADEDEQIKVHFFSLEAIRRMLGNGELEDAKTLLSIYWYLAREKKI